MGNGARFTDAGLAALAAARTLKFLNVGAGKFSHDFHVRGIPDYTVVGPGGKVVADGESTGRDIDKLSKAIRQSIGELKRSCS